MRFGAKVLAVEPVEKYFFGQYVDCVVARVCFSIKVSDLQHRTIRFILLMYPLYGLTVILFE